QKTGSFKLRGAYTRLTHLTAEQREKGVVAASAGNHAQGVAYAAKKLGIKATIFMPLGVALPKLQATRGYGAAVELGGVSVDECITRAKTFAAETGATFVSPFDDARIITGQGTLGLEIVEDVPDVDTIIVPVGGGGLIAGVAMAAKERAKADGRQVRVIGVQSENVSSYKPSLAAGKPLRQDPNPTIADGIAVLQPGELNLSLVQQYVDEFVTVSDEELALAIVLLLERAKLSVEPSGAAGVAAIVSGKIKPKGKTAVVLSGGNFDPLLLQKVIGFGLASASRYLKLRVALPDRPGQLVRVAELIAKQNANVVEVIHTRHSTELTLSAVGIELHIETRGVEHGEAIISALRTAGYRVQDVTLSATAPYTSEHNIVKQ
ncbi:MAG: threonine ammonia-lyase, partial [Microbacteriaceae bacterium]|nr:threonine ammonia-lyase [Microbacteriaceae bacterium]